MAKSVNKLYKYLYIIMFNSYVSLPVGIMIKNGDFYNCVDQRGTGQAVQNFPGAPNHPRPIMSYPQRGPKCCRTGLLFIYINLYSSMFIYIYLV